MANLATEVKLYGRWSFEDVEVKDISLEDYIACKPKSLASVVGPYCVAAAPSRAPPRRLAPPAAAGGALHLKLRRNKPSGQSGAPSLRPRRLSGHERHAQPCADGRR